MPTVAQSPIAGPGFTPTADMVNHPNPQVRAAQVANLAGWLQWAHDVLDGWIETSVNALFAPSDATYVTINAETELTNERRLAAQTPLQLLDGGAGSTVTIKLTRAPIYSEVATGLINSANVTYVLANTPIAGTVRPYLDGQRMVVTTDWTIAGATVTMVEAPATGSNLIFDYEYTV